MFSAELCVRLCVFVYRLKKTVYLSTCCLLLLNRFDAGLETRVCGKQTMNEWLSREQERTRRLICFDLCFSFIFVFFLTFRDVFVVVRAREIEYKQRER